MAKKQSAEGVSEKISFDDFKEVILNDYRLACESRETSLLGRKEVLTGKAKFGIFGDGKEVAQIAMAKVFKNGDFRSGYYRDQTFMFATGTLTLEQWFAGLYAHADAEADPMSSGRQMGGHYATHSLDKSGHWNDLTKIKNSSADLSPTGSQMPRLLGLALASKFYKENKDLQEPPFNRFSNKGNEIAFGTIGDASTSEGMFWETLNAAGVLQVPMVVSVWDDGHGISVPKKYQTTKESISDILAGFQRNNGSNGIEILKTRGWDYPHLCETYEKAAALARREHVPVVIHVEEVTQPQGHSTSGSHERYKSKERLQWELEYDPIKKMRDWIIESAIVPVEELDRIESEAKVRVREAKNNAWKAFNQPLKGELTELIDLLGQIQLDGVTAILAELKSTLDPTRKEIISAARRALWVSTGQESEGKDRLKSWLYSQYQVNHNRYSANLYNETDSAALKVTPVTPTYSSSENKKDGREIIRDNFDVLLKKYPALHIFGEDSGKIGGVNQGLEGLQKKYGELRVFDTGIRECTILGQAIGMAMRGLRPIAEIQYLDYLLYAIQIMSDDLATVQYRTNGTQRAPVIVRTRGHRLEGIWHSGSPMGMIINSLRGVHVCVPRNMTVAAGFYNTLLAAEDPALVIEPLNSYRLKENCPENLGEFRLPLGKPEILNEGSDVTLVTYGPNCRLAMEAVSLLKEKDISVELIDVQTLLPFDIDHSIAKSLKKTNRLLILDEDVPGGASAFILQKILEEQKGYKYLDSDPKTLTGKEHRPAYGSDGDYFSKPSVEDIFEAVYDIMNEVDPTKFPSLQ